MLTCFFESFPRTAILPLVCLLFFLFGLYSGAGICRRGKAGQ